MNHISKSHMYVPDVMVFILDILQAIAPCLLVTSIKITYIATSVRSFSALVDCTKSENCVQFTIKNVLPLQDINFDNHTQAHQKHLVYNIGYSYYYH